jgi:hypothetical protein
LPIVGQRALGRSGKAGAASVVAVPIAFAAVEAAAALFAAPVAAGGEQAFRAAIITRPRTIAVVGTVVVPVISKAVTLLEAAEAAAGLIVAAIIGVASAHLLVAAAAVGVVVAEPGRDLVPGPLEETAFFTAAAVSLVALAIAVVRNTGLLTRASSRVIPVVCHLMSSDAHGAAGRSAGSYWKKNEWPAVGVPISKGFAGHLSMDRNGGAAGDCKGRKARLSEPLPVKPEPIGLMPANWGAGL